MINIISANPNTKFPNITNQVPRRLHSLLSHTPSFYLHCSQPAVPKQHHFGLSKDKLKVKVKLFTILRTWKRLLSGLEKNRNLLFFWRVLDHWLWVQSIFIRDCSECSDKKHFIQCSSYFQRQGNYKKKRLAKKYCNILAWLKFFQWMDSLGMQSNQF